jgi:hypothetical protein
VCTIITIMQVLAAVLSVLAALPYVISAAAAAAAAVLRYQSGARYEGEWRNNLKDGRGVYYFPKVSIAELLQSDNLCSISLSLC